MPRTRAPAAVSGDAMYGPVTLGPNRRAVVPSAGGSVVTATPVSVSRARRTGAREFVGATSQVAASPDRVGRKATPVIGVFSAAATWTGSQTGSPRMAASPEENG